MGLRRPERKAAPASVRAGFFAVVPQLSGLSIVYVLAGCAWLALPSAFADEATVYQCKDKNGTVIFSGTPCGADAKTRVIDAPNAGTGGDNKGIKALANQYDERRAEESKQAAKTARAEAAARAAEAKAAANRPKSSSPPVLIESPYGGYPAPGYYPGSGSLGTSWGVSGGSGGWSIGAGSYPPSYVPDYGQPYSNPRSNPRPHPAPAVPYVYQNPGISGQFPGGAPGSTGSNWKPEKR
ncbi:MAG: hypothetical protein B7Y07_05305 [Halothiobacillus sp. 24-54-40]|nr:MAG: hypothetical protein B7Y07_05305 [Halothiobacillus sp. 24-54-40]